MPGLTHFMSSCRSTLGMVMRLIGGGRQLSDLSLRLPDYVD